MASQSERLRRYVNIFIQFTMLIENKSPTRALWIGGATNRIRPNQKIGTYFNRILECTIGLWTYPKF